jgi:hypothetical protein
VVWAGWTWTVGVVVFILYLTTLLVGKAIWERHVQTGSSAEQWNTQHFQSVMMKPCSGFFFSLGRILSASVSRYQSLDKILITSQTTVRQNPHHSQASD